MSKEKKIRDVEEWMRMVMDYAQAVPGLQAQVTMLAERVDRLEAVKLALENALFAARTPPPRRGRPPKVSRPPRP